MSGVLRSRTYRRLFAAQVVAVAGTGLATVALGLLAYRLAGGDAGAVLGTALAIKMVAYVTVSPVAGVLAGLVPRRVLLVGLDVVRASVALVLPWAHSIWHVYVLIFLLQATSAVFTPTFQATIPDVLPDERDYTRALTLSRLAYDLESLLSPSLAAVALLVVGVEGLFVGTAVGFVASGLLVMSVWLPSSAVPARRVRGIRTYLATPCLRGLLAVHLAVAAGGAMVIVNTVVLVRDGLGLGAADVAFALAANGVGSVVAALALPRLLERVADRVVMSRAAVVCGVALVAGAWVAGSWVGLLVVWFVLGAAGSLVLTPAARLLRRSAAGDRPALFAADFALSHACWLVCYPVAGWVATLFGPVVAFLVLAVVAFGASVVAFRLWPGVVEHLHTDLSPGHVHLRDAVAVGGGWRHAHTYRPDDLHRP